MEKLSYVDTDGDCVTVRNTSDLTEAYAVVKELPTLKLKVHGIELTNSFMTESLANQLNQQCNISTPPETIEEVPEDLNEEIPEESKKEKKTMECKRCKGQGVRNEKQCKLC